MRTCVGLDIGRSSVKVVARSDAGRAQLLFPSSVCPSIPLTDEREAARATSDTVRLNGSSFFFGETAQLQGGDDLAGGLRDDWVFTPNHAVLFKGALWRLKLMNVPGLDSALIVLGLPAQLYASQKRELTESMKPYAPATTEIRVSSQPLGPYQQLLFTADGSETGEFSADDTSWGVIEIGQYTTDYALLLEGRVIENAFGSTDGMSICATRLQKTLQDRGISITLVEATQCLESQRLKQFGKWIDLTAEVDSAIQPLATRVVDKANHLIGRHARALDGILVAGGGAPLLMPALRRAWPHVQLLENPRFAVAEGFHRFALALEQYRKTTLAA